MTLIIAAAMWLISAAYGVKATKVYWYAAYGYVADKRDNRWLWVSSIIMGPLHIILGSMFFLAAGLLILEDRRCQP